MPRRRTVMLMIETSMAYGRAVLRGITRYYISHTPWSIYLEQRELLIEPPEWIESWAGEGIICRCMTPQLAECIRRLKVPTVDLTDIHSETLFPHIWSDHHAIGRMAAQHLLERGFRDFAYCGFSDHAWSQERWRGFQSGLAEAGHGCDAFFSPWTTTREHTWEAQQNEITDWIASLPKPVGVMACNDMRGQHVLDACRRIELAVPEEVAVIGVDDDELLCQLCSPPLSSIVPNAERIGYEAAALLDDLIDGRSREPVARRIEPRGVAARQSTDVLAIDDAHVVTALRYIREHACDGLSVDEVLRHVAMSRSVLERRFRKFLNRSPQAEIRNVQIKRVKQLLTETDLTLERIAQLAGYDHPEYMSVVFKRETSQTPGHFRAQRTR